MLSSYPGRNSPAGRGRELLVLPNLLKIGPQPPIRVHLRHQGTLASRLNRLVDRGANYPFTLYRSRRGSLLVRWEGIGDFLIERQGRQITAQPASCVSFGSFRDLLLNTIPSFALVERSVETLHASSVAWDSRAVAFLGPAGSGKSTLAALLARSGWEVLSDDVLAVGRRGRQVLAYSAVPEIKLSPAAARALGLALRRLPPVEPGNPKRIWSRPAARRPRPLAALYFPRIAGSRRGGIRLVPLSRRATLRALLGCTYNLTLLTRGRLRRQFTLFTGIARNVPARRLLIPRGWDRLEEVRERIEQDLAGLTR